MRHAYSRWRTSASARFCALRSIATAGLTGRCELIAGDAFAAVPSGGDGTYYARITAAAGSQGLLSQYILGLDLALACPAGYDPDPGVLARFPTVDFKAVLVDGSYHDVD